MLLLHYSYNLFFNIDWIQLLVKRGMSIVPAVIGLMLQSSYCILVFKSTALKRFAGVNLINKKMVSNNSSISFVAFVDNFL